MRRQNQSLLPILTLCGSFLPLVGGRLDAQEPGFFPKDARVVWLGDSITHQGLYSRFIEDFLFSRYPSSKQLFVNCGVNGDRSGDALARFHLDVAPWRPNIVFVCLGMNDGRFSRDGSKALPAFQRNIRGILENIRGLGARPILLSPPPVDPQVFLKFGAPPPVEQTLAGYNRVLGRFSSWLREEARRREIPFVDLRAPLLRYNRRLKFKNPQESLSPDGIHPGNVGAALMAIRILRVLGEMKPRLELRIEGSRVKIQGGTLRNLSRTGTNIRFALKAASLPWVLPDEARGAAVLEPSYLVFNRFLLQVTDLPPGSYGLGVDGRELRRYSSGELARGVDLALLTEHPDWIQAEQCVAWNAERSGRVQAGIRDIWEARRVLADLRRRGASKSPGFRVTKKRLETLEREVGRVGREVRILEKKIQEGAQPRVHRYSIQRVRDLPMETKK